MYRCMHAIRCSLATSQCVAYSPVKKTKISSKKGYLHEQASCSCFVVSDALMFLVFAVFDLTQTAQCMDESHRWSAPINFYVSRYNTSSRVDCSAEIHNMLFTSLPYGLFSGRLHDESIFNRHYFPNNYSILTHPVNFPCVRKPENPEKTHDFRQSVEELFSREVRCSIQGSNLRS